MLGYGQIQVDRCDVELNVCVVGYQTLFREGLVSLLVQDGRFAVVSQSSDVEGALSVLDGFQPAVFLLDVDASRPAPSATVAALARYFPESRVIALTSDREDVFLDHLVRSGASVVLSKGIAVAQLIDESLAVVNCSGDDAGPVREIERKLTSREADVLRLVARALSNRDIAHALSIAEGTVKRHLSNIFDKVGATSRWDALRKARRLGEMRDE